VVLVGVLALQERKRPEEKDGEEEKLIL